MSKFVKDRWWICAAMVIALLATSALTACAFSLSGGIAGIFLALALGGLLFGLGSTQTGCSDDSAQIHDGGLDGQSELSVCLSPPLDDGGFDVCLSVDAPSMDVGPCLSLPEPDGGMDLGVCLSPMPPDGGMDLGVCLSPMPPDGGVDLGVCLSLPPSDLGVCLSIMPSDSGSTEVGPCLSPPRSELGPLLDGERDPQRIRVARSEQAAGGRAQQRAAAIRRLGHRLPADVLERLADDDTTS